MHQLPIKAARLGVRSRASVDPRDIFDNLLSVIHPGRRVITFEPVSNSDRRHVRLDAALHSCSAFASHDDVESVSLPALARLMLALSQLLAMPHLGHTVSDRVCYLLFLESLVLHGDEGVHGRHVLDR